jgi:carboxypeptidase Q
LEALAVIRRLGLQPRRTLRVVLWTNEENGTNGARAYREALGADVQRHVAAIEMDGGCERPIGFDLGLPEGEPRTGRALAQAREIASALRAIGADRITLGGGEADISPLMRAGVPGFGLRTEGGRYFHWHHTDADTLDKVDPMDFRRAIAALGVFGYGLADLPVRLGEES